MEVYSNEPANRTEPIETVNAESQIKRMVSDYHKAIIERDLDKLKSFYSSDVVAFDMIAPLQYIGIDAYMKSWKLAFSEFGPVNDSGYEAIELKISASESLAFCHSINHCFGTMKDGKKMDMWMRSTQCFKKFNGKWLITHEQYSIPTDFETGKALMNLKPERL